MRREALEAVSGSRCCAIPQSLPTSAVTIDTITARAMAVGHDWPPGDCGDCSSKGCRRATDDCRRATDYYSSTANDCGDGASRSQGGSPDDCRRATNNGCRSADDGRCYTSSRRCGPADDCCRATDYCSGPADNCGNGACNS